MRSRELQHLRDDVAQNAALCIDLGRHDDLPIGGRGQRGGDGRASNDGKQFHGFSPDLALVMDSAS